MIPRNLPRVTQHFAQGSAAHVFAFATRRRLGDAWGRAVPKTSSALLRLDCYPSLYLWPGLLRVGPTFSCVRRDGRRVCAGGLNPKNFRFPSKPIALEFSAIKTPTRGRTSCARPSFFSQFSHCRWPAACRTLHRAALPGLRAGRLSPMPSTAAPSRAPSSVDLPASRPAVSMWAFPPATDRLTGPRGPFRNLTASGLSFPRPFGHSARMAFCVS